MVDIRRRGRTHCSRKKRVKSFKSGEVIIVSNAADSSRKIKWGGERYTRFGKWVTVDLARAISVLCCVLEA